MSRDNSDSPFSRTEMLLGPEAMRRLRRARVAVFGVGGVGGYVAEALARSGVGQIDLIDSDRVALSNLNRQIIALRSTVGRYKTEVMGERILDINPQAKVRIFNRFFLPENAGEFPLGEYSYIADAVDTVSAKLELAQRAFREGIPIISSMGAGNKLDPAAFIVADIYETKVCPLAKVMRRELKKRGVGSLKVVYSEEMPIKPRGGGGEEQRGQGEQEDRDGEKCKEGQSAVRTARRSTPGSAAFVPSVAGLIMASEIVRDLAGLQE